MGGFQTRPYKRALFAAAPAAADAPADQDHPAEIVREWKTFSVGPVRENPLRRRRL